MSSSKLFALLGFVSGAAAFEDIVNLVNSVNMGWKAEVPTRFGSVEDVKTVCGTWLKTHPKHKAANLTQSVFNTKPLTAIPASFDARTAWPKCTTIAHVRDQSACGSCWAFASTEAFSDSRCIATGKDILFSTQDTAGCCSGFACSFSQGCNGGQPSAALYWMTDYGVVTGGDYFDKDTAKGGCKPYVEAPCAHHVPPSAKYPACPTAEYSVSCTKTCSNSAAGKDYNSDKVKGTKSVSVSGVAAMQSHLMTHGPLAVAFSVYSDFPTYKSGVYTHVSGDFLGGHAVELVGWGTEDGKDYWLIKNSWNEQWGDGGFFKIARGSDECGIEDDVTGILF